MQKEIEIPCIFGDRNIILKSLENERGAIKLPLYILTKFEVRIFIYIFTTFCFLNLQRKFNMWYNKIE